jgi:hypothetical protein
MGELLYANPPKIEKIVTGLTANYVPYWGLLQGLKEAMQNIAYGSVKSGKPAKLYYDAKLELWAIKDKHTGFEKRHLYIGESEQRNDEDGLGTFGEGWKIFLLVMAREGVHHQVDTVGFSFWGTMEDTPHGTKVLVINVKANEQTNGTRVYAEVDEEIWRRATKSFAVLQGIPAEDTKKNGIFADRNHELWVQGVRIEDSTNTNPLNLYYSYNLTQRNLINRDRSHVSTELAYAGIKEQIFYMSREQIEEFVSMALEGKQFEDILRGPYVPVGSHDNKKIWIEVLAKLHACKEDKLIVPSYNQAVNDEAKKRGYFLLDTPRKWDYELTYLGIRKADDVIDDRFNVVVESSYGISKQDKSAFAKAKTKLKKAFGLNGVSMLPEFVYVQEIKNPVNSDKKMAYYDPSTLKVYVDTSIMGSEDKLVEEILPELIVWQTGAKTAEEFEKAYKEIVLRLLGV